MFCIECFLKTMFFLKKNLRVKAEVLQLAKLFLHIIYVNGINGSSICPAF
jgi:hypothetical protein